MYIEIITWMLQINHTVNSNKTGLICAVKTIFTYLHMLIQPA